MSSIVLSSSNPGMRMANNEIMFLDNIQDAKYDIEVVANVLGRVQRFNNHPTKKMSVAEHCIHASYLYPLNPKGALFHDGAEFITGDIPTPVKAHCNGIKQLEEKILKDMARRFDFIIPDPDTFKVVDNILFQTEQVYLFDTPKIYNIDINFRSWGWKEASQKFLERYLELSR